MTTNISELSSLREIIYKGYAEAIVCKGLVPVSRDVIGDGDLDKIAKVIMNADEMIDPGDFMKSQYDGLSIRESSMLTFRIVYGDARKAISKYSKYKLLHDCSRSNYVIDYKRLRATVYSYAKLWQCSEQEVIADPNIPLPAWYRAVASTDDKIKNRYAEAAKSDLDSFEFQKIKENLDAY